MKHKGVSHDDLHRLWGESEREKEEVGVREREIPSAYQSVYLALHVPSLWEEGKEKKKGKWGVDNIRMEKKMRGKERGS